MKPPSYGSAFLDSLTHSTYRAVLDLVFLLFPIGAGLKAWSDKESSTVVFFVMMVAVIFAAVIFYFHGKDAWERLHAQTRQLSERLDDRADRKRVRSELAALLEEGRPFQSLHGLPNDNALAVWEAKVRACLSNEPLLGDAYAVQFMSGAAVPITIPTELSGLHREAWCSVHTRIARLNQFIDDMKDVRQPQH